MTTDNSGCLRSFLVLLSLSLWLLVITTALVGFAIQTWVGCVFVGIVVLTHVVVAKFVSTKANKQIADNSSASGNEKDEKCPHKITEEYYKQVTKASEDLYADYERVVKLHDIDTLVSSMGVQFVMNGAPMTDVKDKVRLLFWVDITRCYTGLGHLIDLSSKEGLGLFYFIALTKGCAPKKPFANLAIVKAVYQADAEAILKGIKAYLDKAPTIPEVFLLSRLLSKNDTALHRKFLVDMYRFASITAKADNTVTDEEAEWLSNILKLQGGGNQEFVPQEDEEEQERMLMGIKGNDYEKAEDSTKAKGTVSHATKPKTQDPTKMLDELIGLDSVKKEVETLSNFIKIQQTRAAKGLKTSAVSYHCVFTGNPGTGKTTVARILAKIYKNLGVVSKGHLVETDRAGLVAEYVGQTAVKTNKIIDSALDGVLFIDEAYSLIGGGESDYGKEAIATLLKRMEDNRDRLIVILAGYTKNMKDFIDSNPGLQSRFNRYIEFPDYSAEELLQIFEANMKKYEYHFGEGAKEALQQYFANEVANKDANFGNGRLVRNVFEKTLEKQANRLAHEVNLTTDKLSQIEIEDFPIK